MMPVTTTTVQVSTVTTTTKASSASSTTMPASEITDRADFNPSATNKHHEPAGECG
jgi:hypothetical protein